MKSDDKTLTGLSRDGHDAWLKGLSPAPTGGMMEFSQGCALVPRLDPF